MICGYWMSLFLLSAPLLPQQITYYLIAFFVSISYNRYTGSRQS
nr:MAG TPA: hypothetical protein [Caudoviricetes sp.]